MVALGLILLLIAVVAGVLAAWLAARSSTGVLLEGAGLSFTVLPLTLLAMGAAVLLLVWLGWRLMAAGNRRRRAEREELRQLRSSNQTGRGDMVTSHRPVVRGSEPPAPAARPATGSEGGPRAGAHPTSSSSEGSGSQAGDPPPRS